MKQSYALQILLGDFIILAAVRYAVAKPAKVLEHLDFLIPVRLILYGIARFFGHIVNIAAYAVFVNIVADKLDRFIFFKIFVFKRVHIITENNITYTLEKSNFVLIGSFC